MAPGHLIRPARHKATLRLKAGAAGMLLKGSNVP